MSLIGVLSLTLALTTALPSQAACVDGRALTVAQEAQSAEAVLIGRVSAEVVLAEDAADPQGITAIRYTVAIQETLRGTATGSIQLRSENTSSRFPMQVGKSYLLFVSASSDGTKLVDSCGNSGLLSARVKAAQLLRRPVKGVSSNLPVQRTATPPADL